MNYLPQFFAATWGKIRLFASQVHVDNSRTQVVHELTNGDIHPVQDRGLRAGRVKCTLLFDDFPGFPAPAVAFAAFKAAVDSGAPATFSHPLSGSYLASVGEFTWALDENSTITADVEFIPEEEIRAVSPTGATATGTSGESSVSQATDDLKVALEALYPEPDSEIPMLKIGAPEGAPDLLTDAKESAARWNTGETGAPTREVINDTARLSDRVGLMIESGGLEEDLAFWPVYRAAILLGEAIRSAAIAATSEVSSVFVMRVLEPTALLPLAARVYGGAEATDRARQIANLNDIRTPGWLDPGDYLMPTKSPAQRSPF